MLLCFGYMIGSCVIVMLFVVVWLLFMGYVDDVVEIVLLKG